MKKFVWLLTLIVISTSLFTPAVAAINKDNIEEKFIYGCGVEENLKPYGDYVEEVVSESSGFIALEMANVFSDSEEYINLLNQILLLTVHLICRKIEIHSIVLKARVLRHL